MCDTLIALHLEFQRLSILWAEDEMTTDYY